MNTTEYFKRTIQAYLEERAMEDEDRKSVV